MVIVNGETKTTISNEFLHRCIIINKPMITDNSTINIINLHVLSALFCSAHCDDCLNPI